MKKLKFLTYVTAAFFSLNAIAQDSYENDRVYAANQVSNTVSVVDPSNNKLLGEIKLGSPIPNVLTPLYKGQTLVHGLRYSPERKLLAVVSIGSNAITFISTENNEVLKTIYVGRSPHEPTFTPDGEQLWVTIRGESYVSVIDVDKMEEIKRVPVADGPGMIAFSPDGELAFICSSFSPELDVVDTDTYEIIKRIPISSSFSPNIFTSTDGKWVALTLKDIGRIVIINAKTLEVEKEIKNTGGITNHVTFSNLGDKQLMSLTVGAENLVRVYDVENDFTEIATIPVGGLPHGLWPSHNGERLYVGLEFSDEIQAIDLRTMKVISTIQIGQSPQALVYANNAVSNFDESLENLKPLNETTPTQTISLNSIKGNSGHGILSVRPIGVTDMIEQIYSGLTPGKTYTLAFTKAAKAPFSEDYEVNTFVANAAGKFHGQSVGLIKSKHNPTAKDYKHLVLIDTSTGNTVLLDNL